MLSKLLLKILIPGEDAEGRGYADYSRRKSSPDYSHQWFLMSAVAPGDASKLSKTAGPGSPEPRAVQRTAPP